MKHVWRRAGWRTCAGPLAVLALLAGAQGCGGSSGAQSPGAPFSGSRTAPQVASPGEPRAYRVVSRAERRQRAAFALLRTRPEGLPPATRRLLGAPIFGIDWRLAQRIPVALPGAYWLVPGNGHLCVVEQGSMGSPGAGTTCASTADAVAHGIADITVKGAAPGAASAHVARARLIVGVAPDGAREVLVHTRGRVATVPVVGEIFVLRDAVAAAPDFLRVR